MTVKRIMFSLLIAVLTIPAMAQFTDHTTGLMNMPTADMQKDGTVMITNNWLNSHNLPPASEPGWGWGYDTFAYGFSITFLKRIELVYACTIINGCRNPFATEDYFKMMFNQDRHLVARVQALKEGEFGKKWIPSLVLGVSDPVTGAVEGGYIGSDVSQGNGYFNRMYIVATKHFDTPWGELGAHLGYQYSLRKDRKYNAPCAGVNWRPKWLRNQWFDPDIMLEFDSMTFNMGFVGEIWKDHFEMMFELQDFKYVSVGIRYKFVLIH